MNTLILAVFLIIILGVIWHYLPQMPVAEPFRIVIKIVLVLILVLLVFHILSVVIGSGGLLRLPY